MLFYEKHTKHILKYHLVTAEPPFTVKMIGSMHQRGPKKAAHHPAVCYPHAWCLPSLSLCRLLCPKWELFIKHGVKVNGQYCWNILLSQQMLSPWHIDRFPVPVSGTSQLVPETSRTCHGFRYRFLPVPAAGSKQNMFYFATGYRYETRAVIGPRVTHTNRATAMQFGNQWNGHF